MLTPAASATASVVSLSDTRANLAHRIGLAQFETLEADCRQNCHVVSFACENAGLNPQADEDHCTDYCVDLKDQVLKQSDDCAQSYEDMMTCVGDTVMTCEDWTEWAMRSDGGACTVEARAFDQKCDL